MADRPAPLLVAVDPAGRAVARLPQKLQLYFQSKQSGGGECDVRAEDPPRGLYRVLFHSAEVRQRVLSQKVHELDLAGKGKLVLTVMRHESADAPEEGLSAEENVPAQVSEEDGPKVRAKRRVQASEDHSINSHDPTLNACLLQDPEAMNSSEKSFSQSLISQTARPPLSTSSIQRSQNSFEKMQPNEKYTVNSPANLTKKIFLSVSAALNTDLFTREERGKVTLLWPSLKIEKLSSKLGVEEVSGDYGVVEELHSYFEGLLAKSFRCDESTNPERQNGLERMAVNDQKEGSENGVEESSNMEVPSAIFEYFSHVFKGEVEDLEQRFSIKVTSVEDGSGMTSIRFASAGSPGCIEKAQQTFVTAFQKVAADLKQEIIPLTDTRRVIKTSEMLNANFKSLFVKPQGDTLILRGPARDLSAAKELMKETEAESLPRKPEVNFSKTGILVDTDVFDFVEPKLATEIHFIKQKYGMLMEKKKCLRSQKTNIVFRPETKKKTPDVSAEVYEIFHRVYQRTLEACTEKTIPLKHSLDLEGKGNEFFMHLQTENPEVFLERKGDKLIIFGFPEPVCSAEKHILRRLNSGHPALHSGTSPTQTAKAGTSSGASPGASPEYNSGRKGHSFPSEDPSSVKAAKAGPEEAECSICMDKIDQKEVLPKCKHVFCRGCIQQAMKYKPVCPVCNMSYGKIEGNQPPGKMEVSKLQSSLPGFKGSGTIIITYHIFSGTQNENHPHPGRRFWGSTRTAYLPDNKEGREILQLLQRAFDQKLIFTVGQSRTTGMDDVVTWNDIHHKTNKDGGANGYGYPDPNYLKRVREELKAKGIE